MSHVIEVQGLGKNYGSLTAVKDVSFEVGEGEIFGLWGPNDAGKATIVECLQGLRQADSGRRRSGWWLCRCIWPAIGKGASCAGYGLPLYPYAACLPPSCWSVS
jgi:energy-coupling factor transporter ATP-binding protein EcfA2